MFFSLLTQNDTKHAHTHTHTCIKRPTGKTEPNTKVESMEVKKWKSISQEDKQKCEKQIPHQYKPKWNCVHTE